jgi:hypothetical protein
VAITAREVAIARAVESDTAAPDEDRERHDARPPHTSIVSEVLR